MSARRGRRSFLDAWPAVGVGIGAGVGMALGGAVGGAVGMPIGLIVGAGVGALADVVLRARGPSDERS